jgi:peptidase E
VNRTTTVYLTGGGPGSFAPLRRHLKNALGEVANGRAAANGRAPLVAYVGAASDDNAGFFRMIRDVAQGATKARMRLAKLASPKAKTSEARALLEDCDLVFVSGGDVEHGMHVLHDRDMVKSLRSLARAGKPMFGISAGSLMLAREWVRFPDDDSSKAELFPCLGIVPVHVDAHAEEEDWEELRVLVHLLGRSGRRKPVGHGLTRGGGLRLDVAGDEVRARAIGTPIPRIVVRRGKVVDGRPLFPPPARRTK